MDQRGENSVEKLNAKYIVSVFIENWERSKMKITAIDSRCQATAVIKWKQT